MTEYNVERTRQHPDYLAHKLKYLPSGRYCRPDEIAEVVRFLATTSASNIQGHNLVVDGATSLLIRCRDDPHHRRGRIHRYGARPGLTDAGERVVGVDVVPADNVAFSVRSVTDARDADAIYELCRASGRRPDRPCGGISAGPFNGDKTAPIAVNVMGTAVIFEIARRGVGAPRGAVLVGIGLWPVRLDLVTEDAPARAGEQLRGQQGRVRGHSAGLCGGVRHRRDRAADLSGVRPRSGAPPAPLFSRTMVEAAIDGTTAENPFSARYSRDARYVYIDDVVAALMADTSSVTRNTRRHFTTSTRAERR
jgi:hypothetical protein